MEKPIEHGGADPPSHLEDPVVRLTRVAQDIARMAVDASLLDSTDPFDEAAALTFVLAPPDGCYYGTNRPRLVFLNLVDDAIMELVSQI